MSTEAAFSLSPADLISPTWKRLHRHLQAEQTLLRARLENDMDPIATAKLRGEARVIRNLLALDQPDPAIVADEE